MKTKFILSFLFLFAFFLSCTSPQKKQTQKKNNILLIIADDLGFTDLGCYGSEIKTPTLDALAAAGIRNTAFYTSPMCSPTRGMLLSGVDNHRNGYGTMEGDWAKNQIGVRGYEGHLNYDVVTFPKLLQDHGYHTSIAGKWHQAFPVTNDTLWPDKRGFTRSFCLLNGGAGHFSDKQRMFSFYKKTYYNEDGKEAKKLPDDFYSSDFYTDKVISYIDESIQLGKPFFSQLSFTAPHWPLQVPEEYIDLYKGRYDAGYEALAKERFRKGQQLGVISQHAVLPPLSPNVIPWDKLSSEEQKKSARTMEIYAAMIERLDANVGRLIAHLKSTGQFENTLLVFMADNGAEGNSISAIVDTREWVEKNFDNSLENMGRKNSYIFTGPSWAQVSTLPFRWYKSFSTEGGVRCPSIIHYPKAVQPIGTINRDYISVMDLAPTFLEWAGTTHPGTEYKGRKVFPLDGTSLLSWLNGSATTPHLPDEVHCWELYGRRAVLRGEWKANWQDAPYGHNSWELYNLEQDPGELDNLASKNPDLLKELIAEFEKYAIKYDLVLPSEHVGNGPDDVWREEK